MQISLLVFSEPSIWGNPCILFPKGWRPTTLAARCRTFGFLRSGRKAWPRCANPTSDRGKGACSRHMQYTIDTHTHTHTYTYIQYTLILNNACSLLFCVYNICVYTKVWRVLYELLHFFSNPTFWNIHENAGFITRHIKVIAEDQQQNSLLDRWNNYLYRSKSETGAICELCTWWTIHCAMRNAHLLNHDTVIHVISISW